MSLIPVQLWGRRALRFLPQAVQDLYLSDPPKTRCSSSPQEPPPLDSRFSHEGPQPPPSVSSDAPTWSKSAPCHPGPQPPEAFLPPSDWGHSQFPCPALSTRAAAGLPGFPFSLTPKPSWVFPTHPALGAGRYRSPPSLGPWPLPFPQITYSPHTGCRSAPQTGAAGRPKGPPALTRVGPALAYLPRENSAARSPAILPVAQSARTRRHPRRLRPGPGPGPDPKSRPPSSDLRLRSAELEIPPRDRHQISYPRYRHSPAAAPDQLKRHCLYLGRQWPPSATTSPMTTGPPSFILLTYPLDNGAAALLSDWLNLPARHRSLPPLSLNPVFAPAWTWSVLAQALVVIG